MRAAAVMLVALAGCGRIGLPRPYPGEQDAAPPDTGSALAGAPDAAPAEDRAPAEAPEAPADAPVAPWPLILRIENVGERPVLFPRQLMPICDFQLTVRAAGGTTSWTTSVLPWDTWCACDACRPGRLRCESIDWLCDDTVQFLAPGAHFDFPWDGLIDAARPYPPEAGCAGLCDAWELIAPGRYVINISEQGGQWDTEVSLPSATGIVVLPVRAD